MTHPLASLQSRILSLKKHPLSEADTGRLIIEPLLQILGYDFLDWNVVREQVAVHEGSTKGNTGQADYGLRMNDRFVFMIEAKKLGSPDLNDSTQIKKANDYCNHTDRPRFAILTDGQFWKLYDQNQGGRPSERLLLDIDLLGPAPQHIFLLSLQLHQNLVDEAKIIKEIKTGSVDPSVRQIIIQRSLNSLYALCPQIEGTFEPNPSTTPSVKVKKRKKTKTKEPSPTKDEVDHLRVTYGMDPPTGVKPCGMKIKQETEWIEVEVNSWRQVLVEFVRLYLPQNPDYLIGWKRSPRSKTPLFSHQNETSDYRYEELQSGLFINTNYSAKASMQNINALIDHLGLDQDCYMVFYQEDVD